MNSQNNFENAFGSGSSSLRGVCECGKVYYNSDNGWDFEEGEIELLEKDGAIDCEYSITHICFEGKEYVNQCDCWKERVSIISRFIGSHSRQIAEYLNLERERLISEAKMTPVVKVD